VIFCREQPVAAVAALDRARQKKALAKIYVDYGRVAGG